VLQHRLHGTHEAGPLPLNGSSVTTARSCKVHPANRHNAKAQNAIPPNRSATDTMTAGCSTRNYGTKWKDCSASFVSLMSHVLTTYIY
jgi:hypothetical protein